MNPHSNYLKLSLDMRKDLCKAIMRGLSTSLATEAEKRVCIDLACGVAFPALERRYPRTEENLYGMPSDSFWEGYNNLLAPARALSGV